jgi:hypothetical protein
MAVGVKRFVKSVAMRVNIRCRASGKDEPKFALAMADEV